MNSEFFLSTLLLLLYCKYLSMRCIVGGRCRTSIMRAITTSIGATFASGFCDLSRAVAPSAVLPRSAAVAFRPTMHHMHYSLSYGGNALTKARLAASTGVRRETFATMGVLYTAATTTSRGFASKRPRATGSSQPAAGKPEVRARFCPEGG